ncbi:DUF2279 domain-containing protein [Flavobacterium sp. MAH-1]|uniref:DUF2279 domain-containing protein n=1 Tax=Flavobacterium agri TaxID=2743471 RepID=A0A7Y8Y3Z7_9FLAO|nr:DUF2279 domain-containing protein [Flavobacterium agri]NUY82092.1 DUF2279 domain-containing protein [Flavobacterium agri]NYA72116.1 DUF2279 domain-containing protein [Flavobacterium agri]
MKPARLFFGLFLFLVTTSALAQNGLDGFLKPADSLNVGRRNGVIIAESVFAVGTYAALNQLWYADYDRSDFHFINDNAEWMQMDKVGHVFSTYHLSNQSANLFKWSGMSQRKSSIYGAATGFAFVSAIEIFDGFSQEWGASTGDLAANATGTLLFIGQELLWKEQRITPKFSFHKSPYASVRPDVLGSTMTEQIFKDYNGQTYWLSANVHSFFKQSKIIPKWLNVAFGYGATGMVTGENDPVNLVFLPEKGQLRQYYFSLDADLTKIRTNSHLLKTLFSVVNTIKIPAPTIEVNGHGDVKFRPLYF